MQHETADLRASLRDPSQRPTVLRLLWEDLAKNREHLHLSTKQVEALHEGLHTAELFEHEHGFEIVVPAVGDLNLLLVPDLRMHLVGRRGASDANPGALIWSNVPST